MVHALTKVHHEPTFTFESFLILYMVYTPNVGFHSQSIKQHYIVIRLT